MLSRLAGRLVTGPLAFAVAGILDLVIYAVRSLTARATGAWRSSARSGTAV